MSKFECIFYVLIDHQTKIVLKHVTIFANEFFDQSTTLATLQENTNFFGINLTSDPICCKPC